MGIVFGIMVLKGAELPEGDKRRKYKYRVVFQGNNIINQKKLPTKTPPKYTRPLGSWLKIETTTKKNPNKIGDKAVKNEIIWLGSKLRAILYIIKKY